MDEGVEVDEISTGDLLLAEAKVFAADWAAKRDEQQQRLRQQRKQQEGAWLGKSWSLFFRSVMGSFGWPEGSVREGSGGAGGAEQEGGRGKVGFEVGEEGFNFEAAAAANAVAVKI